MIIFQKVQYSCWGPSSCILDRRKNEGQRMLHNICTLLVIRFVTKCSVRAQRTRSGRKNRNQRRDKDVIPITYPIMQLQNRRSNSNTTLIFRIQGGWGGTGSSIPSSTQELGPEQPGSWALSLYMQMSMDLPPRELSALCLQRCFAVPLYWSF